jgi:hypothetical protein
MSVIWCCRRVASEVISRILAPFGELPGITRWFQSAGDPSEKLNATERLLKKIRRAGLHDFNGHRNVALSGNHDGGQRRTNLLQPPQ